jgi:hypothetical protein
MFERAAAMLLFLGVFEACSSSHASVPLCTYAPTPDDAAAWACPGTMTCGYSGPSADGTCHGVTLACALPCEASTDCSPLGENVICSSTCGSPVCTPYQ